MTVPSHIYTVEIRFYGDPSDISQRLRLDPTLSEDGSNVSSAGRTFPPFWGYNGEGQEGFQPEWQSLETGLEFLTDRLQPLRSAINDLSGHFEGIWWCGHFQAGFDGGPTLSPKILADIAGFGLPLFIDNYFSPRL